MKRPLFYVSLCLLCSLAMSGCGGGSGGGMTDTGLRPGPHLYRDLKKTLPEVLSEQANSPDQGVVREFSVTESFLLLLPRQFTAPDPPTWAVDDLTTLDSRASLWPGVNDGHVLHIRGRAGLRGTYPFTGEDAAKGWGNPSRELTWLNLFGDRHSSEVGIEHDIAFAYADSWSDGADLEYAAYGWWAMAPTPGGGASDTTRTLSAHGGMSFGIETFARDMPGAANAPIVATWSGRATGHAQDADGRYVLVGDASLNAELRGPSGTITSGMIENMRITRIDPQTLQVMGQAGNWHTIQFRSSSIQGDGYQGGRLSVSGTPDLGPRFTTPTGNYEGVFYGPEAVETAGQFWIIEAYPDRAMGEMTVVGAFGARKQQPQP